MASVGDPRRSPVVAPGPLVILAVAQLAWDTVKGIYGWSLDHWCFSLPVLVFILLVVIGVIAGSLQDARARGPDRAATTHPPGTRCHAVAGVRWHVGI
jgi:hypothetical protein